MQVSIRDSLISAVNADFKVAYPTIPIVYDNAAFDRNSPPDSWVDYEIDFHGGDQIGMEQNPRTRVSGFVYVTVWARAGAGSRAPLAILDWFAAKLGYTAQGEARLQAPEPSGNKAPKGWFAATLKIYFYADPT